MRRYGEEIQGRGAGNLLLRRRLYVETGRRRQRVPLRQGARMRLDCRRARLVAPPLRRTES